MKNFEFVVADRRLIAYVDLDISPVDTEIEAETVEDALQQFRQSVLTVASEYRHCDDFTNYPDSYFDNMSVFAGLIDATDSRERNQYCDKKELHTLKITEYADRTEVAILLYDKANV